MFTAVRDLVEIILKQQGVCVFKFDGRMRDDERNGNLEARIIYILLSARVYI